MLFDPLNFIKHLKSVVTGDEGFFRDVVMSPNSVAVTTATRATAENSVPADVIVFDANGEDAIPSFLIPRDYDEQSDELLVTLLVAYVSGTSLTIQPTAVSRGNASTAVANEADFTVPTATLVDSSPDMVEVEADLSDLGWEAGDMVAVNFAVADVTGSGIAHVVGCKVSYRSTLVAYNESSR